MECRIALIPGATASTGNCERGKKSAGQSMRENTDMLLYMKSCFLEALPFVCLRSSAYRRRQ